MSTKPRQPHVFHNGPLFKDHFELRHIIAGKTGNVARGFTGALIEYALGRPVGFTDAPLADEIMAKAKAKDFALREFIREVVFSREFGRK